MEWLESLILGVVQGVTEFLPVSSDGHLRITQQAFAWLTGKPRSGQENLFFIVILHVGTLGAILFHYRAVIGQGVRRFLLGAQDVPRGLGRASIGRVGLLAAVATSPLVPFALFFKKWLEETFQSDKAAGVGFLITAGVLLLVTHRLKGPEGSKGPAETTWLDALLIGLAQMFAPLPGVSRSGLTVGSALALGFSRTWSVGFSLLIAVPAICGGVVFELKDVLQDPHPGGLTADRTAQMLAATVLAGLVGYAAILWLIRVVRAGQLWYFSVYLILLGIFVLTLASMSGGSVDGRFAKALDRTSWSGDSGAPARPSGHRTVRPVDRADAPGARSGGPAARGAGLGLGIRVGTVGVLLG